MAFTFFGSVAVTTPCGKPQARVSNCIQYVLMVSNGKRLKPLIFWKSNKKQNNNIKIYNYSTCLHMNVSVTMQKH